MVVPSDYSEPKTAAKRRQIPNIVDPHTDQESQSLSFQAAVDEQGSANIEGATLDNAEPTSARLIDERITDEDEITDILCRTGDYKYGTQQSTVQDV
jgi:hypothetical protein